MGYPTGRATSLVFENEVRLNKVLMEEGDDGTLSKPRYGRAA